MVINLNEPFAQYTAQVPWHTPATSEIEPQALALHLQLTNIFMLLALLALVCCWTSSAGVARRYLVAVAIADLGHIWVAYKTTGPEYFWNPAGWNDLTWGNVGVSIFLHVNRWLTVAGLFGTLGVAGVANAKKTQ